MKFVFRRGIDNGSIVWINNPLSLFKPRTWKKDSAEIIGNRSCYAKKFKTRTPLNIQITDRHNFVKTKAKSSGLLRTLKNVFTMLNVNVTGNIVA